MMVQDTLCAGVGFVLLLAACHAAVSTHVVTRATGQALGTYSEANNINTVTERLVSSVNGCPKMCSCDLILPVGFIVPRIIVINCTRDPGRSLLELFQLWNRFYQEKFGAKLTGISVFPCKGLSSLGYLLYLDLSENAIKSIKCEHPDIYISINIMNVSYNNLSVVPCSLIAMKDLKALDLSHNNIQTVPCDLSALSYMHDLDLSHNHLKNACNLGGLRDFKHLNLSYNRIEGEFCNLYQLQNLEVLDLGYNHLKTFPCELTKMPKLQVFNLSHNHIDAVSCGPSGMLPGLYFLDLSNNNLATLSDDFIITEPDGISSIDLSWNHFQKFPCIKGSVFEINLDHNQIEEISKQELACSDHLFGVLTLNHNMFKTFPCGLIEIVAFTLKLNHNQIKTMPCVFLYDDGYIELDLSYNQLSSFPCFPTLLFNLSHNFIREVHCSRSHYDYYQTVDLSYNNLRIFPCELATAHRIERLELSHNKFHDTVCSDMTSHLVVLDLSHNHIQTVPSFLKNCTKLLEMKLEFNEISFLANESFYGLGDIVSIYLNNNNISKIESGVFMSSVQFNKLRKFRLDHNYLNSLDSWPVKLAIETRVSLEMNAANNKLCEFSNFGQLHSTPCASFPGSHFLMQNNNIKYITDVFHGWNLTVDTSEEMLDCMLAFDFSNNPLVCDCTDYDVYAAIHERTDYRSPTLTCSKPEHLKGKNPASLPLERFVCVKSVKCPQGCSCHDTPHFRKISVVCTEDYKQTRLPNELPEMHRDSYSLYLNWRNMGVAMISHKAYFSEVTEAIFSHNVIRNVTLNALLSLATVSKLYLDNNQLQRLPGNLASVSFREGSELTFSNNPWVCDCNSVETREWFIQNHIHIKDLMKIPCSSPPHTAGKPMVSLDASVMCSEEKLDPSIMFAILSGIILVLLIGLPIICIVRFKRAVRVHKRKDWEPREEGEGDEEEEEDKEFDVFVTYDNEDEEYVGGYLIPELENRGFKVCFHRVHFIGGKTIIDNICECIAKSKKVLAFYSMNYKESRFGMYEFTMTMDLDIREGTNRLITIKAPDLDVEELQISHTTYFRTHTYIIQEEPTFWRNLLYTLPVHRPRFENMEVLEPEN